MPKLVNTNTEAMSKPDQEEQEVNESDMCRQDIRDRTTEDQRRRAADAYGENWANIMSGFGDQ